MANLTLSNTFFDGVNGSSLNGNFTATLVSSNWVGGGETIGTGWTQLTFNSGSLTTVLAYSVQNLNTGTPYSQSIVSLATGSAGQGIFAQIYPGQLFTNAWSGSFNGNNGIYASVTSGWANNAYIANPGSASIQWQVQQN